MFLKKPQQCGLARNATTDLFDGRSRCLGLFVSYPSVYHDSTFLLDSSAAIQEALAHENMTVRIRASWALGLFVYHQYICDDQYSKPM
jgi:hypothetical protein